MNWTAEGTDFCPLMGLVFSDTFCGVNVGFEEASNPEFSACSSAFPRILNVSWFQWLRKYCFSILCCSRLK